MCQFLIVALFSTLGISSAFAQASDPNSTCADYMKLLAQMGPQPKTGDAAADDMDKKINDYCKANPTAKLSDAMEKAMQ